MGKKNSQLIVHKLAARVLVLVVGSLTQMVTLLPLLFQQ